MQVLGRDACFAVQAPVAFPCEEEPVYILIEIADAQLAPPAGQVGQSQGGFRICEQPGLVGYLVFVRDARFAFLVKGVHVPGIFVGGVGGKGEQVSVPIADASFRTAGRDVRLVPVLYRPVTFGEHCPDVVFRLPEEGVGFIRKVVPAEPRCPTAPLPGAGALPARRRLSRQAIPRRHSGCLPRSRRNAWWFFPAPHPSW